MNSKEIFSHIDHSALKAYTTWAEIKKLCEEALQYIMASVCIPQSYVSRAKTAFGNQINICTVIGFPLGYNTTDVKVFETHDAIKNGADEIDMVVNLGLVKAGDFDAVSEEIQQVKTACGEKILKVIVETCYLTDDEKKQLCKCVTQATVDYIKTSTGFGPSGAAPEDILLFKQNIGAGVKIKAAGGIRSYDDFVKYIELGCDRIGTSSALTILDSL